MREAIAGERTWKQVLAHWYFIIGTKAGREMARLLSPGMISFVHSRSTVNSHLLLTRSLGNLFHDGRLTSARLLNFKRIYATLEPYSIIDLSRSPFSIHLAETPVHVMLTWEATPTLALPVFVCFLHCYL